MNAIKGVQWECFVKVHTDAAIVSKPFYRGMPVISHGSRLPPLAGAFSHGGQRVYRRIFYTLASWASTAVSFYYFIAHIGPPECFGDIGDEGAFCIGVAGSVVKFWINKLSRVYPRLGSRL